tara:strand:+ start:456 stop:701 length:246 start_codon:yes stop_codon:yes gene_type:complete
MKDNKLIAQFMWEHSKVIDSSSTRHYHTSWDWLMPVVEKCVRTGDDTDKWDNIFNALTTLSIEKVYEEVVEFINQYNNNES